MGDADKQNLKPETCCLKPEAYTLTSDTLSRAASIFLVKSSSRQGHGMKAGPSPGASLRVVDNVSTGIFAASSELPISASRVSLDSALRVGARSRSLTSSRSCSGDLSGGSSMRRYRTAHPGAIPPVRVRPPNSPQ